MPHGTLDPHAELGVAPNATPQQVARAYRRLAKRHHPDLHREPAAAERMQRINHAWQILSRPGARARHDAGARSAATARAGHWAPPFESAARTTRRPAGSAMPRTRRPPRPEPADPHFGDSGWVTLAVSALLALLLLVGTYLGSVSRAVP
ncbi:MAG: J domain-containing protein [Candidatus Limnocylindria bacterium]